MEDKAYSSDGEMFHDFETVMDSLESDFDAGEEMTIYEGEKVPFHHASFFSVDDLIERMQEDAYEQVPEFADSYLDDLSVDSKRKLQDLIIKFLNENAKQPDFYQVKNVKEIKVKVGNYDY